jgi:sulfatase maturation enzyme AslB (radical SAM superfamily)
MKKEDFYILNPDYTLKLDKKRIFIINSKNNPLIENFIGFVHPVYAIILSLFNGEKNLDNVEESISQLLKKERPVITNLVSPLLENKDEQHFNYDGYQFSFPKNLLVKKKGNPVIKKFNYNEFVIPKKELDMTSWRLYSPLDIMLMINTNCVTNCIYCFADRSKNLDCRIPLERLRELIKEAKALEMRTFDLTGGELFLYIYIGKNSWKKS